MIIPTPMQWWLVFSRTKTMHSDIKNLLQRRELGSVYYIFV